ncbi:hypothetical protein BC938DRAFT_474706 [Jimgerdemannia flammicorona]|uniref:Uncharacterized protein n=1 Tax=Jimgerdemannia flammicorona TaxID=994334 RepID=A0A433Q1X3_9FUNG|nr:hypothetical protein BC938DRAFT_474706 [Jimgerdemannia flammicorona]
MFPFSSTPSFLFSTRDICVPNLANTPIATGSLSFWHRTFRTTLPFISIPSPPPPHLHSPPNKLFTRSSTPASTSTRSPTADQVAVVHIGTEMIAGPPAWTPRLTSMGYSLGSGSTSW